MAEITNLWNIPQIGENQVPIVPSNQKKKPDLAMLDNAPCDVTIGSFFWKVFIWLLVWFCVAALLFGAISAIGWLTMSGEWGSSMLWIILPIVGFIVNFVWNVALALLYNIFFSKKYYNFGKMFGLIFASSIIIFLFFFLIYLLFQNNSSALYLIFGLQLIFSLFISLNLIDFLAQPNYSASSLIWNTLWSVLSICVYLVLAQSMILNQNDMSSKLLIFLVASAVITYTLSVFGSAIWDAIYYKFYEWWNNPFYLPSLSELREKRQKQEAKEQKEEEEVNVDLK